MNFESFTSRPSFTSGAMHTCGFTGSGLLTGFIAGIYLFPDSARAARLAAGAAILGDATAEPAGFRGEREYHALCLRRLLTQARINSGSFQGTSWNADFRNSLWGSRIHSCGNNAIVSFSVTLGAGCSALSDNTANRAAGRSRP